MNRKVEQIVDPETGKVVAEKQTNLFGDPIYRSPSENWIQRAAYRTVRIYALISTVLSVAILLLEEFSPYYAELALSDVGAFFAPGIFLAFWWGIRAIKEAVDRDETIRYAKNVGKEKVYHIVDPDTGKKENCTFLVVTDQISYADAFAPKLEPESSVEHQKMERMARRNENVIKLSNKVQEYHIVDPNSGKTVANQRSVERILQEDAPKSKSRKVAENIGAVCIILFWPLMIAAYFASEKLRPFLLFAIAALAGILIVLQLTMGAFTLFGRKHRSQKEE